MDLVKELKNAKTIGITGHVRPDGDCVGAVISMYLLARKICPEAEIVPMIESVPEEYLFLEGTQAVRSDFNPGIEEFDIFIGLDSSTTDRYGEAEKFFLSAGKTIVIDHHETNEGFGDVRLIDGNVGSSCELIYSVIPKKCMDIEIAKALYVGIISDTGVLQYSCTSPETMRIVASLMEYGFDFSDIIEKTFYEKTRRQNEILGRALMESIIFMDGKCIVAKVDKKTMDFYGADSHDLDGIATQLRYTKGVEVSIFMHEIEPMVYKISLRSKGLVDVAKIAKFYNGGGHKRAAGFTMNGTFHDCVNNISDSIAMQLEK